MDEKKIRKAVQMLRIEKKECKKLLDFHGNKQWNSGVLRRKIEDCNTAIEALEKQLPKKVEMLTEYRDLNGNVMCFKAFCPSCGRVVESYRNKNCHVCTQVLDWSE